MSGINPPPATPHNAAIACFGVLGGAGVASWRNQASHKSKGNTL